MGFFSNVEKILDKATDIAGDVVNKVGEATEGWGDRADKWLSANANVETVKETVSPVAETVKEKAAEFAHQAEEVVTKVVNDVKTKAAAAKAEAEAEAVNPEPVLIVVEKIVPEKKVGAAPKAVKTVAELKAEAKELGIKGYTKLSKDELVKAIKKIKK